MSRVYLVRRESGEYSDHLSVIEAVFSTRKAAESYIESKELEFVSDYDGHLFDDLCEGLVDGEQRVVRRPTRHGNSWYVDNDRSFDSSTWFVDEMEVIGGEG